MHQHDPPYTVTGEPIHTAKHGAIGSRGTLWLIAGGLSYTVGVMFHAAKRMTYHHVIWYLFVLVGSLYHFVAIAWYVLPVPDRA